MKALGAIGLCLLMVSVVWADCYMEAKQEAQRAAELQQCWDYHRDIMERLRETESPYVMPCVNCVLDRSETPYCNNLCGPTPYEGLDEILTRGGM